jgi:hypothetical protein
MRYLPDIWHIILSPGFCPLRICDLHTQVSPSDFGFICSSFVFSITLFLNHNYREKYPREFTCKESAEIGKEVFASSPVKSAALVFLREKFKTVQGMAENDTLWLQEDHSWRKTTRHGRTFAASNCNPGQPIRSWKSRVRSCVSELSRAGGLNFNWKWFQKFRSGSRATQPLGLRWGVETTSR